jgi:hypothetical protein
MTRFIVRFADRRLVGRDQRASRACVALVAASASRDRAGVRLAAQGGCVWPDRLDFVVFPYASLCFQSNRRGTRF